MLQHQIGTVKQEPQSAAPQPTCACGKRVGYDCDYPACSVKMFRPDGVGLGTAPHRREGRRTAAILANVWERAVRVFGLSEDEIEDALRIEQAKATERAESRRLVQAELDAGAAAFLAGVDYGDPILSTTARQGWQAAKRNWENGYRCGYDGVLEPDVNHPSRSLRKGWEAGRDVRAVESGVSL